MRIRLYVSNVSTGQDTVANNFIVNAPDIVAIAPLTRSLMMLALT